MQYLSKAYNFYSGINPATLSGAIDVIVVKHVDEDGEVILSSSPFHVRFGKLQVLRAAEKRVTLRLPNNLPPPHVAPFSMKVGEAGEAFFVLETDEEVPEDLLTSPVVSPTDANELPPTPPLTNDSQGSNGPGGGRSTGEASEGGKDGEVHPSLTQQPFGQTEQQVSHQHVEEAHDSSAHDLADVEPFDLDRPASPGSTSIMTPVKAPPIDKKTSAAASPSSILNTASSLLPSIPFLSSNPSSNAGTPRDASPELEDLPNEKHAEKQGKSVLSQTGAPENPENPVVAGPGESTDQLERNDTLSTYKRAREVEQIVNPSMKPTDLPKVEPGQGEGPDVVYGKDIVLDVSGYHAAGKATEEHHVKAEHALEEEASNVKSALKAAKVLKEQVESPTKVRQGLVDAFTQDLLASIPSHSYALSSRPGLPAPRSTDPDMSTARSKGPEDMARLSEPDLSITLDSLSLETEDATPSKREAARRRADRGQSEPPPDLDDEEDTPTLPSPPSPLIRPPNGSIYPYTAPQPPPRPVTPVNLPNTWDWARVPPQSPEAGGVDDLKKSLDMERSASGPPARSGKEERARSDSMPASGMDLATPKLKPTRDPSSSALGRLKDSEESPYLFVLEMDEGGSYTFELALCDTGGFAPKCEASEEEEAEFLKNRITFPKFIEDSQLVDDPRLVVRYSLLYMTWTTGYSLLSALSMYRRSLTPTGLTPPGMATNARTTGSGWSKWFRRGQGASIPTDPMRPITAPTRRTKGDDVPPVVKTSPDLTATVPTPPRDKQYAKTLRLSSDQLKSLNLKPGPNTVHFSVTSSYSGLATCTARIFLWDDADQIVISDIDGTITKSDALGHVFAAIGRDWTHLGIAKLYTDIANNGYKILYLTSRAIGQADSTREYLKSIVQSEYRLPEGPVIMSPDRLMASLHREVIMRKPELFKMACLRDIQRLFGQKAKESFFAGFGNRITDAMSYRSVGIDTSKIYTIDSNGVVKTELLQAAGHRGSYVGLNDLVNETFPPVGTKFKPEFTDFNWWRSSIPDIALPDLTPEPVSPALSARSASSTTSSRYNVLGRISQTIGRKSSKQPLLPTTNDDAKSVTSASSRPSSPLIGPALSSDDLSEDEDYGHRHSSRRKEGSMPGSFESQSGEHFPEFMAQQRAEEGQISPLGGSPHHSEDSDEEDEDERRQDSFDDGAIFDDDILATGEMKNVPF